MYLCTLGYSRLYLECYFVISYSKKSKVILSSISYMHPCNHNVFKVICKNNIVFPHLYVFWANRLLYTLPLFLNPMFHCIL